MARAEGITADEVREVALTLPDVVEQLTWEVHPTFRVRGKIFVILGEDGTTASVKASLEDQQALIRESPEAFAVAPHTGRYGWVLVSLSAADRTEVAELVVDAWRATAPKRTVAAFDGVVPQTRPGVDPGFDRCREGR